MKTNRELPLAVKRALATGTLALCGAGSVAAYATPATATQPNAIPVTTATTSTVTTATTSTATTATTSKTTFANAAVPKTATAKTTDAKQPIALAQATVLPQPSSSGTVAAPELQTVVVTGTLIARPAAETAEAITVIRADTLKSMGITNVEEAMNTLTNNVPTVNISSAVGSFSGGGTYADLRGLGNGRTLVLLDGQRLANNANTGNAVDLSGIPFSAIDSIQVLREGASALYGSDAIAGVVNFITKRDYQGGEIRLNVDHPQEAGGRSGYANFTIGHGDLLGDGYNAMLTASYSRQDELRAGQRSFTAEGYYPSLGVTQTNNPGTWPASILDANGGLWQPGFPACAGNPYLTTDQGNCAYRYSAATDLIPKSTEASALASLTKALPANNTVQLQYLYSRSTVTAWAGPMFYAFEMTRQADPAYYPTSAAGLTCEANCNVAPDLTDPIVAEWTDPNNNRITGDTNTEQRALVTFSGDNGGWGYKLNLNYSENRSAQTNNGDIPDEAVLAPTVDPNSGLPILSNLINPFGPQSAAGQALIERSYISGTFENGRMKRWSIDGNANHSLGDAFDAGTPATLALGFSLEGDNFSAASTPYNDLVHAATGFSDTSIEGSRTAQAVFVELDVPVSKSLDLDVSDREDRYSDFGRTNNGKVTVRYQPSHYLTFRGAASTGFRAPTLFDLYSPNNMEASSSGTMGTGNPFCQPGSYNAEWTQTACASQGLGLFGGNKQLTPETSQNFDLGVVVAPIRNLGITLDYYRINLKNTIGAIPSSAIYGDPTAFASDIHTNDAGTLTPSIDQASICTPYTLPGCGYIILTSQNTGAITTNGVDVSVQYLQHTALGTFKEDLEGTSVTQYRLQLYNGGPILNLVGWNQAGNLNPPAFRWQHELRLDWTGPDGIWGAGLSNRFYSSYIDQFPINSAGTQRIVGSQSTWDGYASYKPISTLTLLVGIQNLFNTNPPFTNAQQNNFAAGYSALFSNPLLRTFYVNLTYKFL
ncbi:MAG TPA: TonB-dependent receptor [Steroidobacteraceae bacterium]|nr:TonB-dependent receptor [Steroidobacteraceae bacterium]